MSISKHQAKASAVPPLQNPDINPWPLISFKPLTGGIILSFSNASTVSSNASQVSLYPVRPSLLALLILTTQENSRLSNKLKYLHVDCSHVSFSKANLFFSDTHFSGTSGRCDHFTVSICWWFSWCVPLNIPLRPIRSSLYATAGIKDEPDYHASKSPYLFSRKHHRRYLASESFYQPGPQIMPTLYHFGPLVCSCE